MNTLDIIDTAWSGETVLLTVELVDGDWLTTLTVRASFEYDRSTRQHDVTLRCERVLSECVGDVDLVPERAFVGADLERRVMAHEDLMVDTARGMMERERFREAGFRMLGVA